MFNITYNELYDNFSDSYFTEFVSLNKDLLLYICEFLQTFDQTIKSLSDEKQPTIHKVVPLRKFLINHCAQKPEDAPGIRSIKGFLRKYSI